MKTDGTWNLLVCGTKKDSLSFDQFEAYRMRVVHEIFEEYGKARKDGFERLNVLEGCCKNSADMFAESIKNNAFSTGISIEHFPGTPGTFLKKNIEMADKCDSVIAFWDGFSYGTAHTIATAVLRNKEVRIIDLREIL